MEEQKYTAKVRKASTKSYAIYIPKWLVDNNKLAVGSIVQVTLR